MARCSWGRPATSSRSSSAATTPEFVLRLAYRCERWREHRSEGHVVITDDRHLVGDGDAHGRQASKHTEGEQVVGAHDRRRARLELHERRDGGLTLFDAERTDGHLAKYRRISPPGPTRLSVEPPLFCRCIGG